MKNKWDILLLLLLVLSCIACVWIWFIRIDFLLYLTVIPFFSLQLLLCRGNCQKWVRHLTLLPVIVLGAMALFYLIRDSGWDRLGALIFGLAAIAPAVGIALGWCVWWICRVRHKRRQHEGA